MPTKNNNFTTLELAIKEISKNIQEKITSFGNPEKAKWLENYVKHNIKSKGVGIPTIRQIILETNKEFKLTGKPVSEQTGLLNDLMNQEYTEDKLAAIIYLQLFWKGKNQQHTINLISEWFDTNLITDWNVCDWLCVRILTPMIDAWTDPVIKELEKWNKDKNQWKARASLVPFAQCKTIAQHKKIIKCFSVELIKRKERFCKTVVGWVLREYSKIDSDFVTKFILDYENLVTKEVIKNATKYIEK